LLTLQHPVAVSAVGFSPDGARLATSAPDGMVRFWDVTSGQELLTIAAVKYHSAALSLFQDYELPGW
jgi:WD40 repeat protein